MTPLTGGGLLFLVVRFSLSFTALGFLYSVWSCAPIIDNMPLACSAKGPSGFSSRYFSNASLVPGTPGDFAVGRGLSLRDQIHTVLIMRIGIIRIGLDGFLEGLARRFGLAGIHQNGAEIVME